MNKALRHISNRKSAGCDGIPIELLKAGGEEAVKVMTGLCNCIWKRKEWPTDWKKSVYVPIYKKGDKQECGNTTLIAGTKEDLIKLVGSVRRASEKAGLYLNVGKTKVMTTGGIGEVTVDGKDIEVVTKFVFLVSWERWLPRTDYA